jgi:hypothetical protein
MVSSLHVITYIIGSRAEARLRSGSKWRCVDCRQTADCVPRSDWNGLVTTAAMLEGASVTHVSGITCYPSLRKGTQEPVLMADVWL